jgi:DNA-binding response OmpR family regulator
MQLQGWTGDDWRGTASRPSSLRETAPRERTLLALRAVSRKLWIGDRSVKLTPHEVTFINLLRQRGGRALPRGVACTLLWGARGESYEKRLDLLVKRLRDKLGADHDLVLTVAGCGHRLRTSGLFRNEKITTSGRGSGTRRNHVANRPKM